jgi:cupin fold WbuC family metalloprotein
MKIISADYLDSLTLRASRSVKRRQHENLHVNYSEPCQRLFNAIEPNSYIQPHRHLTDPKVELLIAVRGSLAFVAFDNEGNILKVLPFGPDLKNEMSRAIGLEIYPEIWHTVIALEAGSILLEVKSGPFDPSQPKDLAPWAPQEGSVNCSEYLRKLVGFIENELRRS